MHQTIGNEHIADPYTHNFVVNETLTIIEVSWSSKNSKHCLSRRHTRVIIVGFVDKYNRVFEDDVVEITFS